MIGKLIDKLWKLIALLILETVVSLAVLWFIIPTPFGNETVFNSITIFWVSLMGFTIYLYGDVAKKPKFDTMGLAFLLFAVFLIIDRFEGYAVKISAFAALLVAIAAFVAILETKRLRTENRRLAVEERHMIAIEQIRKWAVETFHPLATPNSRDTFPSWQNEELAKLQSSSVDSMSILYFAERVGGDLEQRVIEANLNFQKYLAILMGEEVIKSFKERHKVEDDIKPITNIKEAEPLIKELMDLLKEVIRSAVAEMVPDF
jgi:hypothetical protein